MPSTRPKRGDLSHCEAVRDPLLYKGVRSTFRRDLKAPVKYRTDLTRRMELLITPRNQEAFLWLMANAPWSYAGFHVKVRRPLEG